MKNTVRLLMAAVAVLACAASCREPLYEEASQYRLEFDYSTEGMYFVDRGRPELVSVILYDRLTGKKVMQEFMQPEGGALTVGPGSYSLVAYAFDTKVTTVKDEDYFTTIKAVTESRRDQNYTYIKMPDRLWAVSEKEISLPFMTEGDETYVVRETMRTAFDDYLLVVTGVTGLENAGAVECYITGQVPCRYLGNGSGDMEEVVLYFAGVKDLEKGEICTPFSTFGRLSGKPSRLMLNMNIAGANGAVYSCVQDITSQFEREDHIITIDYQQHIEPKEEGGVDPSVRQWDEEFNDWRIE